MTHSQTDRMHPAFVWEVVGLLGGPFVGATFVACVMQMRFNVLHLALLIAGLLMLWLVQRLQDDPAGYGWVVVGKVGAQILAATLIACLLSETFDWLHALLMGLGIAVLGLGHWHAHHVPRAPTDDRPDE